MYRYHSIFGVDFSGAKDAGRKIWIAEGVDKGGKLSIERCESARTFLGARSSRRECLRGLRNFIAMQHEAAFGLDFPFSLPQEIIRKLFKVKKWEGFVRSFTRSYREPEAFRKACRTVAQARELKRCTEAKTRAPLAGYNLRLYRQTFFGVRNLLAPLVRKRCACVLPMQAPVAGRALVLEICPASTLRHEKLPHRGYKGKTKACRNTRELILDALETKGALSLTDSCRSRVLDNQGGDGLDSIVAAYAVFRTVSNPAALVPEDCDAYLMEGYIYV